MADATPDVEREGHGPPGMRERAHDTAATIKLIASIAILVALVLLGVANSDDVRLDYFVGDASVPLIVVILGSAVAGALVAALVRRRRSS